MKKSKRNAPQDEPFAALRASLAASAKAGKKLRQAIAFLQGPDVAGKHVAAAQILALGKGAGIAPRTLRRAAACLRVDRKRANGACSRMLWRVPGRGATPASLDAFLAASEAEQLEFVAGLRRSEAAALSDALFAALAKLAERSDEDPVKMSVLQRVLEASSPRSYVEPERDALRRDEMAAITAQIQATRDHAAHERQMKIDRVYVWKLVVRGD